ncbi:osmoprotectant transport system substrate-binding protein [Conyzicola lurida]|uniref:Osmoprotectant transport system substrate-binding protein n=1 Tax=Conyzicola lurida TaxID=1172621 RepID=A0A841AHX4_9MICO|nr:ABC transporter substrate-binding protein [Conyzicola lurida]MBB5843440.1 osmoprotectant transport system substrate-binding protein [Conyzicola lurida]
MHVTARPRILAGALAIGLVALLSGCGSTDPDPLDTGDGAEITIGAQATTENRILAQIYGQVLAAHGYSVDYNEGVGDRASFVAALQSGSIDLIPDSSGALLYGADPDAFERSQKEILDALPDALEESGLHVLAAAPADNAEAFVVTAEYSDDHQVTSIGDLAYHADSITIGANADFDSQRYGSAGLLSVYGISGFETKAIDDGGGTATVGDLLTGVVQVGVIPSTSPSIALNQLVVLRDPKSIIAVQNIIPLVNDTAYRADVQRLLDPVSALITTDELRDLNEKAAGGDNPSPERVAATWLTENDLLDD